MKEHQIYNSALEDVLLEFKEWWDSGDITTALVKRIKGLKKGASFHGKQHSEESK